jgi:hypothetical protein
MMMGASQGIRMLRAKFSKVNFEKCDKSEAYMPVRGIQVSGYFTHLYFLFIACDRIISI